MVSRIPLGNICDKKIDTLSSQYDGKVEYIDISSTDNVEKVIVNTQAIDSKEAPSRARQLVKNGDILVSTVRPNLNAVAVIDRESNHILVASTGYCVLRCNSETDNHYVFHFCQSPYFIDDMVRQATGASYPAVSSSIVRSCLIPSRSLEEQRCIATALDKLADLISLRKQQLAKLDELVKARFVEMFGDLADPFCKYHKCTLVEACLDPDDIKCGPFGTQLNKDEYQVSGIAVWEIPQINSGFTSKPTHFLTEEKAKQLKSYSIEPGDIAMSRKGNVGKCGLFPGDYEPGIIHSDVLRIRVDSNRVIPCFMMHQLRFSRAVQNQIEMVSSGAIMAGVNVTKLKQIEVYIPEYELQENFTAFVGKIGQQKLTIQQSLDKLEVLKKSLMQEYFGGA